MPDFSRFLVIFQHLSMYSDTLAQIQCAFPAVVSTVQSICPLSEISGDRAFQARQSTFLGFKKLLYIQQKTRLLKHMNRMKLALVTFSASR